MGKQPEWKENQKNASVYLGNRDDPVVAFLVVLCENLNMSESEFFRRLYHQYLIDHGLMDDDGELVQSAAKKIKRSTRFVSGKKMPSPVIRKRA